MDMLVDVLAAQDRKGILMSFFLFLKGPAAVAATGAFPAIMSDEVINEIASMDGFPTDEASKEALQTSTIYLEAPYAPNVAEINKILDTYHKDIMNGDISIDEGIQKMNEEVSALK